MKIKGNLIIFGTDNEKRKDVRKLKEKKLQIVLDEKNNLPTFEINNKEYIKDLAELKIEELFGTDKFYIEQLYTWADPNYYTKESEMIITYLVVINKKNIKNELKNIEFYDVYIKNKENSKIQDVVLSNETKEIKYEIETVVSKKRKNIEYTNKLVENSDISELNAIIIHTGIKRLRNRIENTNIVFSFLDDEFAISELQQVYEIILDKKLVPANFRKKIEPMIKKTGNVVKESAYRPSNQYTFNEDFVKNWV
ncbi:aDP-ribose pyrophosphatase [Clostridium sp. CAG:921]|nr:aDP-ribose pyrophosphatase [Clostridium sp. CAG:921]